VYSVELEDTNVNRTNGVVIEGGKHITFVLRTKQNRELPLYARARVCV